MENSETSYAAIAPFCILVGRKRRIAMTDTIAKTDTIAQTERKNRMHHVLDYIFKHVEEETSLSTLSKVAHFSPFHLQKVFKQVVGDTPKQFALKLRLETA